MSGPVLRDIHLPPAHWWPPAPGWWLVAVMLLLAASGVAWWLRRSTRGIPVRAALREVAALEAAYARDGDIRQLVDGASRLMRRVALHIAPGAAVQTGAAWRAFVLAHAPDGSAGRALDELAGERFRPQPKLDAPALLAALPAWCRTALRARNPSPFQGKTRGDEARKAQASSLDPPSFRSGKQALSRAQGVAPKAPSDQAHSAPRDSAP